MSEERSLSSLEHVASFRTGGAEAYRVSKLAARWTELESQRN
jgi:hypothetical protein